MTHKVRTFVNNEKLVQEKRQHITKCAEKLFLVQGFDRTTIRQISDACCMPPGSIYNYIGTKNDILHLICANASSRWKPTLEEYVANYKQGNMTNLLSKCIDLYFHIADEVKDENLFFDREIRNFSSEDRHMLLESQTSVVFFFDKLLNKGIHTGEFKMDSTINVAHNILMAANIWGERRWFLQPRFSIEEYTQLQINFILNAIRADSHMEVT